MRRKKTGAELITLASVAASMKKNRVTVWRWATTGVGGVRLATVRIGRRLYTSRNAIEAFRQQLPDAGSASEELNRRVREMLKQGR